MLTHGSLFSGIGGFDLASEWMGWENVFHCEYDPSLPKQKRITIVICLLAYYLLLLTF